jgi:hypothetical protein
LGFASGLVAPAAFAVQPIEFHRCISRLVNVRRRSGVYQSQAQLAITLFYVVALFKILRRVKESLPNVFEIGIPNSTEVQRRTDLLNAWSAELVEESELLGATWV